MQNVCKGCVKFNLKRTCDRIPEALAKQHCQFKLNATNIVKTIVVNSLNGVNSVIHRKRSVLQR